MREPELVTATQEELDEILALAKTSFPRKHYELLEGVLATFVFVMLKLQNAKTSIKRFQRMLFGARTEHKRNVLELAAPAGDSEVIDGAPPAGAPEEVQGDPLAPSPLTSPKPPKPGHGRNAAQAYSGAPIVECEHGELESGDRCPQCDKGRVYDSPPRTLVKVVGQAPLGATVYRLQRLRCRLCDAIFTAALPAAVASCPKYDSSCAAMIALLRYGSGLPHFRLEGLQASLYVPLPDATQWDIVSKAVPGPRAAFQELIRQAAQAPLLYSDDTPMKVLSLMAERAKAEADGVKPRALAINTSGIVAVLEPHKVVLFFTGHDHAGKNMERVLAHRAEELQPPMQMCDALASNIAGEFATILCNCLTHGRRQVLDVVEHFPESAGHVIEVLAKVYEHDAACRKDQLSPEQRLAFHEEHSLSVMDDLQSWMTEQFKQRQVEPNSGLGKALRYLLKHWEALTLFLRKAGAPLGRVEMWRGGFRSRHRCFRPFGWRCPMSPTVAPFPHPPRRTGRALLTHPALFRHIKPSRSSGRVQTASGVSASTSRRGTGRSIGGTPFPVCHCAFATRPVDAAPCSCRCRDRFAPPAPD